MWWRERGGGREGGREEGREGGREGGRKSNCWYSVLYNVFNRLLNLNEMKRKDDFNETQGKTKREHKKTQSFLNRNVVL